MQLIDLVVDATIMGQSKFLPKHRRKLGAREFLVIMTTNGWLECPVCEWQMEPNSLENHIKRGCQEADAS